MEGLVLLGTHRKHVNVLQHLIGYLKKELSSEDKQEMLGLIEDYRQELGGADRTADSAPSAFRHLQRHPVPNWVWDARGGCIWRLGRRS